MRLMASMFAFALMATVSLSMPAAARSDGDEAGTLKGARGAPSTSPATPKAKPGKGSGIMEEEGIFYFKNKPAGGSPSKPR